MKNSRDYTARNIFSLTFVSRFVNYTNTFTKMQADVITLPKTTSAPPALQINNHKNSFFHTFTTVNNYLFFRSFGRCEFSIRTGRQSKWKSPLWRDGAPFCGGMRSYGRRRWIIKVRRQVHGKWDRHDADQGSGGKNEGGGGRISCGEARDHERGTNRGFRTVGGILRQWQGELLSGIGV